MKSKIQHHDGHLEEYGSDAAAKAHPSRVERQRWYSMLLHIARERDRKEGWAAHKFKERPNGLRKVTQEPDMAVLSFVRHTQIRWSRGRAA